MFISNTEQERGQLLEAIGVKSFKELIKQVPEDILSGGIKLPDALDEAGLFSHVLGLGGKNKTLANFAGAGAYDHFIPSAVKALVSRGEFLTAYTPYQAEASQGTLQSIYEFQSSVCALFGMDASNASLYDGASALAEAVNACLRITSKNRIVYSSALHPHYKAVLKTYFSSRSGIVFAEMDCAQGSSDINSIDGIIDGDTACLIISNPNFYGSLEDMSGLSAKAHAKGALFIAVVDPVSLGVLSAPGEYDADFAVAEGQGLGNSLNYGGPYLGLFACKKQYIRHMPGRICGMTKDADGKRAFVLTLQAREQHIRREKAASNICSNEALCALSAVIYLSMAGPQGLKEIAEINIENAHLAAEKIAALKGFSLKFKTPFFNEFVVKCPQEAAVLRDRLLAEGICAGVPLGGFYDGMKDCLLVCVTETKSADDIDNFVSALRKYSNA